MKMDGKSASRWLALFEFLARFLYIDRILQPHPIGLHYFSNCVVVGDLASFTLRVR
jgi:hypothetical protein